MKRSTIGLLACAGVLGLTLAGCDDSTGVDTNTTLTVLLTDAPADYIGEAMVDIGAVELVGGSGGPIVLSTDGTDGFIDLLDLQGVATEALANVDIEAGTYSQLRLVVEAANVTLATGYEFDGGGTSMDLTVPSGAQTGIKLNLGGADGEDSGGGLEIAPGETVLIVDFDVNESFVIQGNPNTPAGIKGMLFRPTLRVVVNDVAGSISGTVSTQLDSVSVEGLVVTAEPLEGTTLEPFQGAAGSAMTDADGAYTIFFLVPGDYEVSVAAGDSLTVTPDTVTVGESEAVTGVDFDVVQG
jgi:uncharacterized protein DUF4382/carboxypeptidase family protein